MNYYELLEVSPKASQEVLKAAYKSLMQRYHPDRNQGNTSAAEHAVLVIRAYEVLSDSAKRAAYDSALKWQLENLNRTKDQAQKIISPASLQRKEGATQWFVWLLIALSILIVFVLWFFLPSFEASQSENSGQKLTGPILGADKSTLFQTEADKKAEALAQRTIDIFIQDLNVTLEPPEKPKTAPQDDNQYVLSIQSLGVVVGTFDPNKFISFLSENKEYISRKLTEKLAKAQYEELIKHNGEHYLKQQILDSIGIITATNRFEDYPSSESETPAHYGAVDVLLPDSFTVKTQKLNNSSAP